MPSADRRYIWSLVQAAILNLPWPYLRNTTVLWCTCTVPAVNNNWTISSFLLSFDHFFKGQQDVGSVSHLSICRPPQNLKVGHWVWHVVLQAKCKATAINIHKCRTTFTNTGQLAHYTHTSITGVEPSLALRSRTRGYLQNCGQLGQVLNLLPIQHYIRFVSLFQPYI